MYVHHTQMQRWTCTELPPSQDLLLPLLPAPRPPPPDFTIGRLKQTAQRLYVAIEPFYKRCIKPLLKLATWKDPRRSFVYCAVSAGRPISLCFRLTDLVHF